MSRESIRLPVVLDDGTVIQVQAAPLGGEENVSAVLPRFEEFTRSVESIAAMIAGALARIHPDKAAVEFGVEVGIESGKLTALLVKGTGSATLKITLEWIGTAPER